MNKQNKESKINEENVDIISLPKEREYVKEDQINNQFTVIERKKREEEEENIVFVFSLCKV